MGQDQDKNNPVTPAGGGGSGDRGWTVFTPVTPRVDGSSPCGGGGGSGTNATRRGGTLSAFRVPASRRRARGGGGVSPGVAGGDGGGGSGAGAGDYRLMDNSEGTSFMARSPESMSVAMSLGSESSDNDLSAATAGEGGVGGDGRSRHGGGAASVGPGSGTGFDGSMEAGGSGDPEESFSDILSP